MKFNIREIIRFGIVGIIATIIHYGIYLKLGMPDKYAPIPVFCIAVPINFLMVRLVLKSKNP